MQCGQPANPPPSRKACSCGLVARPNVALRKPPEATDDVGVSLGVFGEFIVAVAAREREAAFLIGEIFRVLEWQIEELALDMRDLSVEPASDGAIGDGAGNPVGRVGAPVAAEHVARELVEHDDERERTLRRLLPGRELAVATGLPEARKARRDLGVEDRVLLVPLVRASGTPECKDLHGADRLGGARDRDHSRTSAFLIRL